MFSLLKKMIRFRVGQKVSRGAAKKIGLGPLSGLLGIIGGVRTMRRR